jgi:glucosamine 6-phosphate synthetase-like amidotransferase/phosphosugar isomerase protein
MCGVLSTVWNDKSAVKKVIMANLPMLTARGKDAWGIAIGTTEKSKPEILKKFPTSIGKLASRRRLHLLLDELPECGWMLVHSRLATDGYSGIIEHNHPVKYKNITLVHNGLVTDWPASFDSSVNRVRTDSQNLAKLIHEIGSDVSQEYLNQAKGEITISWHDEKDNKIRVFSNVGGLYRLQSDLATTYVSEPLNDESLLCRLKSRTVLEI